MNALRRRLFQSLIVALLLVTQPSFAIGTAAIAAAALSPDCLEYRVVGICFWLLCTIYECDVEESVQVRHYNPDAVVSSYSDTGHNPWSEVASLSAPNATAQHGGDGTTNQSHENNLAKFKNADVIGHPETGFSEWISQSGYSCPSVAEPLAPYLLSTLDTVAWRYDLPEAFYPEALTPGLREIGSRQSLDLWGNVYPRGGFLHQADDFMAAAVVAERAGDVVTRSGQIHVYRPLLSSNDPAVDEQNGYWPPTALMETDASTGKWQELVPTLSSTCVVFPNSAPRAQATDGAYAWILWRPYSCCQRKGEVFLGHTEYAQ
jgi:integrating conjugative element protein (TIGR03756 family)